MCLSLLVCSDSCGPPWPCACVCEFIISDSICGSKCYCKVPVFSCDFVVCVRLCQGLFVCCCDLSPLCVLVIYLCTC